ncbi:MAG: DOMON-like domain-containing protein [Candidatus Binatia bacterium]
MTHPTLYKAELRRHPTTPIHSVRGIEVQVGWGNSEALSLTFVLTGDLTRVRIPAPQPSHRADNLWRHTCFEAFLRYKGEPAYYEFNFAPSGAWAAYAFRRYRDGASLVQDFDPRLVVRETEERLELDAFIRLDCLPLAHQRTRVQLAFSAVVEDEQGVLSYWALTHPSGKPDFHHPDAFALELERPDADRGSDFAEEEEQ